MIPKIIWQTHEDNFDQLPDYVLKIVETWEKNNPTWDYRYFNAKDREEFILKEFGKDWYNLYNKCIFGAMKADVWKVLIVYKYGGVYSDIDYTCNKPIEYWLDDKNSMVVGMDEEKNEIACHTFAATANNKVLESVVNTIKKNLEELQYDVKLFSYEYTGPIAFTKGIRNYFNIKEELDLINNLESLNNLESAIKENFYCYGADRHEMFTYDAFTHVDGRRNWFDAKYDWLIESERMFEERNTSDS
jgi:mannosyltransferase OCH1-like enzyme